MRRKEIRVSYKEVAYATEHLKEDALFLQNCSKNVYKEYENYYLCDMNEELWDIQRKIDEYTEKKSISVFTGEWVAFVLAMEFFASEKRVTLEEAKFKLVKDKVDFELFCHENGMKFYVRERACYILEHKSIPLDLSDEDREKGIVDCIYVYDNNNKYPRTRRLLLSSPASCFRNDIEIMYTLRDSGKLRRWDYEILNKNGFDNDLFIRMKRFRKEKRKIASEKSTPHVGNNGNNFSDCLSGNPSNVKVKISYQEMVIATKWLLDDAGWLFDDNEELYEKYCDYYTYDLLEDEDPAEISRRIYRDNFEELYCKWGESVAFTLAIEAFAIEKGTTLREAEFVLVRDEVHLDIISDKSRIFINQGKSSRLSEEDKKEGYVDYLILEDYTTYKTKANKRICMLKFPVSRFKDSKEIVRYLIREKLIPYESYKIRCDDDFEIEVGDRVDKYKKFKWR